MRRALIGLAVLAFIGGAAVPAQAVDGAAGDATVGPLQVEMASTAYIDQMLNKRLISSNYINRGSLVGACTVTVSGGSCTIAQTTSVARSIQLDLGITRSWVAGKLGVSATSTQTTSVTCNSPVMRAGQTWKAWPRGTRYSYVLRRQTLHSGQYISTKTSGTLYAFNPRANDVVCGF